MYDRSGMSFYGRDTSHPPSPKEIPSNNVFLLLIHFMPSFFLLSSIDVKMLLYAISDNMFQANNSYEWFLLHIKENTIEGFLTL